jgi:hypothetical protein
MALATDGPTLLPPAVLGALNRPPTPRTLRRIDFALAVWAILWILLSLFVARQILALRDVGGTVVKTGVAIRHSGDALGQLSNLPLVGSDLRSVASQAREAGRSAIISGHKSEASVHRLAVSVGVAIATIAILPPLLLYLPLRIRWARERSRLLRRQDTPHSEGRRVRAS